MPTYYHRTDAKEAIEKDGWVDGTGYYMTSREWSGVWISDRPLDANEGAMGAWVFTLELPATVSDLIDREYEWVEEFKPYREWLVPAALLNEHGVVVKVELDRL